jgi:replication initiation protein RepC
VAPPLTAERQFRIKAPQLLDLAPRLAAHVLTATPGWTDVIDAAGIGLRAELGVSASLWGEACQVLGREQAAVALAIVSTKPTHYFTRGAGGYFAGMVRKAAKGELRLERTLWALKTEKWGDSKPKRAGGGGRDNAGARGVWH